MSLEVVLAVSILCVVVGVFAAVRRRTTLAAAALTLGTLGLLVWVLEASGSINL